LKFGASENQRTFKCGLLVSSNFLFTFVNLIFFDVHIFYVETQKKFNPSDEMNLLKLLITLKYKMKSEFSLVTEKERKKERR
jgi:hypothetical protein